MGCSAETGDASTRTRRHSATTAVVPASHCAPFLYELRERGLASPHGLAMLGICNPEDHACAHVLSETRFRAFLRLSEALAGEPHLGLYAGARSQLTDMARLDWRLRSLVYGDLEHHACPAAVTALPNALTVEITTAEQAIVCSLDGSDLPASPILSEYFLASLVSCVRRLFGPVAPLGVSLRRAAPVESRAHRRILGEHLSFGEPRDAVLLPRDLLARPTLYPGATTVELALALAQGALDLRGAPHTSVYKASLVRALREFSNAFAMKRL